MTIPTVEGRRFSVGKYDVVATPIPGSAHMLRYTVFVNGKRVGAMASEPNESDCRFMEEPPITPPLVPFQYIYRPGRPKKDAPPRASLDSPPPARDELPHGMAFPKPTEER
jgi:hypothetical protein